MNKTNHPEWLFRAVATLCVLFLLPAFLSADEVDERVQETSPAESVPVPEVDEAAGTGTAEDVAPATSRTPNNGEQFSVYVVPIEGPITGPQLYILRRALKEAIEEKIDAVVLDMDTPGGALGTTLEMMMALENFEGDTFTFVNREAISAGSYIAVATNYIYFHPRGLMGAAEAVTGTGEDVNESMARKINSYLQGRVRILSEDHRYRAEVQRAMMDPDFVFEIDGKVLKEAGKLLTLTAKEAVEEYGDPPVPLLAEAIVETVEAMLDRHYGEGRYVIKNFELTWSETFAKWFQGIAPAILGLGLLLLFIEFKTPNFGLIGGAGIALILLVILSNYFAGLAGNEEILVFAFGVLLIAVEIFLFPGTFIAGGLGIILVFGALLWAMADIWPGDGFAVDPSVFQGPLLQMALALLIAVVGFLLVMRFLPRTSVWTRMVVTSTAGGVGPFARAMEGVTEEDSLVGKIGVAVTAMHPVGEVEIDGVRYEGRLERGSVAAGTEVKVLARKDFSLLVHPIG